MAAIEGTLMYLADRSLARTMAGIGLALLVAATAVVVSPRDTLAVEKRAGGKYGDIMSLLGVAAKFAPLFPPLAAELTPQVNEGIDGRVTILMLGSDTRGKGLQRTDTIMVASQKGDSLTAASIPRDTARIPNPFTASTSDYFKGKVNGILRLLKKTRTTDKALADFTYVIENLLQIEIDHTVLVTMDGFQDLVEEIEPITVTIPKAIKDPKFWDNPDKPKGVYFPASSAYMLWAWQPDEAPLPLCDSDWKAYTNPPASTWCKRAVVYVRSRKGKGNNDFKRAGRQQELVAGAVNRVISRGTGSLTSLVYAAISAKTAGYLYSDIPLTYGNALELYNRLNGATVGATVVFGPKTYSAHIPGTSSYQLKLTAVRAWASTYLK